MKIRKITASTSTSISIPYPFNTYYEIQSDAEIEDETGMPAHPSPCEECEGYAIEHLAYVKAKPEYEDVLLNNGLDLAELIRDTENEEVYLAYVVNGRIYAIDESDLPQESDNLYDRDTVMEAISDEFGIDDYDAYLIYDWYAEEGALDDFESIDEFIEYVSDDIYDMLDAADDEEAKQRILEAIESSTKVSANQKAVKAAIDTGLEYWYFTRHGLGPGMMPKGINIVDTYEEGWYTWFKTDKLLTTEELNEYEIKEQWPPEGAITNHGEVIESCTNVTAASCKKVGEDENTLQYVVSSEDEDHIQDIESRSLVRYKGYRLLNSPDKGGWDVIDEEGKQVGSKFNTEKAARKYIDDNCDVAAGTDINSIDLNKLEEEINAGCIEYLTGPEGGFSAPGAPKESRWDISADEVYQVEIRKEGDRIAVEVRAELDYDGMSNLSEILDPIVARYDQHAYFEQVTSGIIEAYIWDNSADVFGAEEVNGVQDIKGYDFPEKDDLDIDFGFEFDIDIQNGLFNAMDDTDEYYNDPLLNARDYTKEGVTPEDLKYDFLEFIYTVLPENLEGQYTISGDVHMHYYFDSAERRYTFDPGLSEITNFSYTPVVSHDNIESSAAMTEEDLDYAIENDKPFDLASFKKYKTYTDPDTIVADKVEVGDVITIDESADQVDLGTVVKVEAINDPAEKWIAYTFRCKVIQNPASSHQSVKVGDTVNLYFAEDEAVGHLIPM